MTVGNEIHPSALVDPGAELGDGNHIGPFAVIERGAVLGNNNRVGAHSVVKTGSRMGNDNALFEHVVFGGTPQDTGFVDCETFASMGDNNVLREFVTVHRATAKEDGITRLGDHIYLMATSHVAHDCRLGDHITLAPGAGLGGHVHVADRAFVSGGVMVHQFVSIGTYAMLGGNAKVTRDVLPYMIADGVPARLRGLNLVGLRRGGLSAEDIRALRRAYHALFDTGAELEAAIAGLRGSASPHVRHLVEFIDNSRRGFLRGGRG